MIEWIQGHIMWGSVGEWIGGLGTAAAVFVAVTQSRKSAEAAAQQTRTMIEAGFNERRVTRIIELIEAVERDRASTLFTPDGTDEGRFHDPNARLRAKVLARSLYRVSGGAPTVTDSYLYADPMHNVDPQFDKMIEELDQMLASADGADMPRH